MPNPYDNQVCASISKGANRVRRALEVANQKVGSHLIGSKLNTRGGALVNTLVSAHRGQINKDRFIRTYQKPKVRAAFSFAIDGSDSMNYQKRYINSGTYWKECISLIHALHTTCQRIGVESSSSLVMFTHGSADVPMASTSVRPVANMIKDFNNNWQKSYPDKLRNKRCNGGTSLISYAETALDMVSQSDATHRIAFFLTDGECSGKRYLESMRLQALNKGIKLVGIGLGVNADRLPNGISGSSALEIAPRMMTHLEKIILSKTGIDSDDQP